MKRVQELIVGADGAAVLLYISVRALSMAERKMRTHFDLVDVAKGVARLQQDRLLAFGGLGRGHFMVRVWQVK